MYGKKCSEKNLNDSSLLSASEDLSTLCFGMLIQDIEANPDSELS